MSTKLSISCGDPRAESIPRYYNTHIYIFIFNDLLTYLYLYEHNVINQLWRPPHLKHPKALQHVYIYNDLLT